MKRALKVLTDREVSPQLGLLKSTLLQLDSTFSERDYGVSTFRDFIEKVAKTGLVTLRHSGRSMMVDSVETADGAELPPVSPAGNRIHRYWRRWKPGLLDRPRRPRPLPPRLLRAGLRLRSTQNRFSNSWLPFRDLFGRATQAPRWPMYVRQLKQYLRGIDPNFDEHRWGFGTIMEFLRVVQREGLLRLERDRRGQIRVFPGSALAGDSERIGGAARRGKSSRMTCGTSWKPSRSKRCPVTSLEPEIEPAELEAAEPSQAEMIAIDEATAGGAKGPQGAESADRRQAAGAKIDRCAHVDAAPQDAGAGCSVASGFRTARQSQSRPSGRTCRAGSLFNSSRRASARAMASEGSL